MFVCVFFISLLFLLSLLSTPLVFVIYTFADIPIFSDFISLDFLSFSFLLLDNAFKI